MNTPSRSFNYVDVRESCFSTPTKQLLQERLARYEGVNAQTAPSKQNYVI